MAIALPTYLSDHPNLVGIVRFPTCFIQEHNVPIPIVIKGDDGNYKSVRQTVRMSHTIESITKTSQNFSIPKSSITDFYPYSYYVLTDGETEPLIMYPQYLDSVLSIKGMFALSNQPIERYYPSIYKGSTNGAIYNITNSNQMMLPTATNEGLQYLNANGNMMAQSRKNQITGNVLNGVMAVGSMVTGFSPMGAMSSGASVISGINAVKETDARNNDIMLTPSTISSFGSPSTRSAFNTDNVRLIRYTVKDTVKNKINNFIDRYGNKYNNYGTIDLKSYKGFIKFIAPDIDGGIDNQHINKIISILERGIYIE